MESINLYKYIKNWLFLKNLEQNNPYDTIIFENFDNKEIEISKKLNVTTLKDIGYEFGINWALSKHLKNKKNPLIIIDNLSIIYLLPTLKHIENINIINLWTWLSWYINKSLIDNDDLWIMWNYNIDIYDPYDMESFFKVLQKNWNKYIRIADKELPIKLFWEWTEHAEYDSWIISLDSYWINWEEWLILCSWYMLWECLSAISSLQQDWKLYSWAIILKHNFNINESLAQKINSINKIIYICDNRQTNWIKQLIIWKLCWIWIYDTEIHIISPEYDNINTNLNDYIFEQAQYDAKWIYEKLSSI